MYEVDSVCDACSAYLDGEVDGEVDGLCIDCFEDAFDGCTECGGDSGYEGRLLDVLTFECMTCSHVDRVAVAFS